MARPTLIEHLSSGLALDVNAFGDGAVLGCDFAGIVVAVGAQVSSWKVGDRIASLVWGGKKEFTGWWH